MPVTGLTLGKFAPLHRGHQLVIDTALCQVDKLVVVVYDCDELPECPLSVRANWISTLYPQVQIVLAKDAPKQTGYSPAITALHDQYLQTLLKDEHIDYFFSSESYGEHVSLALNCIDVRVDQYRLQVPISGTKIRKNISAHQEFLCPLVFNDLISKVSHQVVAKLPAT
ncbi:MAG: adenylyltransferase/cytidyltransferase family protein [Paraglaciecola sp.]|nr:adenylyltransferase/cytidyltransferase family protein [Paraglaciecola sp.]NCT46828.1 adenylyltransferase/cytidyltransferase family protein [Paraglaciecola sp.]